MSSQIYRTIVMVLIATVMGFLAVTVMSNDGDETEVTNGNGGEVASYELRSVFVPSRDLPTGARIGRSDLDEAQWPNEYLPEGVVLERDELLDRVLSAPVSSGIPFVRSVLQEEGAPSGLVSIITKGYRAMAVKVDSSVGVAGFVEPGFRVDVLATLNAKQGSDSTQIAKVILQDILVLAVDQRIERSDRDSPDVAKVVTLEVEPHEAEILLYAAHEGRLHLSLRSFVDHDEIATGGSSGPWVFETKEPKVSRPRSHQKRRESITVIRGTESDRARI